MEFKKYQHVERFGTSETQNIEFGKTYVFPKIDGTNAQIWCNIVSFDGEDIEIKIRCGSRKRELSIENDNQGFMEWVLKQDYIKNFFKKYSNVRLFGEWLVPHSLKTYRESAWKNFYVFDVVEDLPQNELKKESDEKFKYLNYENYKIMLDLYGINYIPPIKIFNNGTYEQFIKCLDQNNYLIENGNGFGEGIVIKNYDFKNKFGRQTWAKIVTSEFKEKHSKVMGAPLVKGCDLVEEKIVNKFVTKAFVEKEFSKIESEKGWSSKFIPKLLNIVYYCLIKEESWNFIKENNNPTINFKTLQYLTFNQIKKIKPELF